MATTFTFGDADEIVCQHPLGDFRFFPKSGESYTIDTGGVRANDDANQITTSGKMMSQLNTVRGSFEGPMAIDTDGEALENAAKLSAHPENGSWTFSLLNGRVHKMIGRPVGDIQEDTNAGTFTLKVAGEKMSRL